MLQLVVAVPQLHRAIFSPSLGDNERGIVVLRLELAEMLDVAAEAIHEVQTIVTHAPTPPGVEVPP